MSSLAVDLAGNRLLHSLQPSARDQHGLEPAGPDLAPCSQNDVDVVVGGVAVLSGNPGTDASGARVRFKLTHGGPRQAAQVEAAPILGREDKGVGRALAVYPLAIAPLDPFRRQVLGRSGDVGHQLFSVNPDPRFVTAEDAAAGRSAVSVHDVADVVVEPAIALRLLVLVAVLDVAQKAADRFPQAARH